MLRVRDAPQSSHLDERQPALAVLPIPRFIRSQNAHISIYPISVTHRQSFLGRLQAMRSWQYICLYKWNTLFSSFSMYLSSICHFSHLSGLMRRVGDVIPFYIHYIYIFRNIKENTLTASKERLSKGGSRRRSSRLYILAAFSRRSIVRSWRKSYGEWTCKMSDSGRLTARPYRGVQWTCRLFMLNSSLQLNLSCYIERREILKV